MAVLDVVVGRQPVFDRDLQVVGYELLFRPVEGGNSAGDADGDMMTSNVLFSSVSIGIDRLVGDKTVFCNVDRGLLVGSEPIVLPPQRTVMEVHESIADDPEALAGARRLYEEGFLIALDDFTDAPGTEKILEFASVVKIDLMAVTDEQLETLARRCHEAGVLLSAERIETQEQLDRCLALGFNYFQGYLLSRPRVVPGRALAVFSKEKLQAAAALLDRWDGTGALEQIIRTEPALAFQVLQIAGVGMEQGGNRGVRSLREALVRLGANSLKNCIRLLLSTGTVGLSEEEVVSTLARARMCELVAVESDPKAGELAYTAGLISGFDLLLGLPIEEVLSSLPLDPELHQAALRQDTPAGRVVRLVVRYQSGKSERLVRSPAGSTLAVAAAAALNWALQVARSGSGASSA